MLFFYTLLEWSAIYIELTFAPCPLRLSPIRLFPYMLENYFSQIHPIKHEAPSAQICTDGASSIKKSLTCCRALYRICLSSIIVFCHFFRTRQAPKRQIARSIQEKSSRTQDRCLLQHPTFYPHKEFLLSSKFPPQEASF